jgi:hypothetical protein
MVRKTLALSVLLLARAVEIPLRSHAAQRRLSENAGH